MCSSSHISPPVKCTSKSQQKTDAGKETSILMWHTIGWDPGAVLWPSLDPWKILCTLQCHQTWQAWLVTAWFGNYEIRFGNCEQRIRKLWCGNYDYDLETQNRTADSETMIQKLRHLIWKLCRKPWVGNYEWETFAGKSATEKSNTDFPNTDFALCHVFSTPEISAA